MLQSPSANPSDEVISALNGNGASLFAKLLYRSNKLLNLINNKQITLILAPTDEAIDDFLGRYKKSADALISSTVGQDILDNHFSSSKDASGRPLPAINGSLIPVDRTSLQNYRITNRVLVGETAIIFIGVVMANPNQLKNWTIERSAGLKTAFGGGDIGNVGLNLLIRQGGIKGKDLINMCNSSFETNDFCNRDNGAMFRQLLQQEFGISLQAGDDARSEYIMQHNASFTYMPVYDGNVEIASRRYLKVSENRHIQVLPQHEFHYGMIILYCLGTDHRLTAYRENHTNPYAPGYVKILPIQIIGIPSDFKIKKIACGSQKVSVLGYDGTLYVSSQTTSTDTKSITFNISAGPNFGMFVLDVDIDSVLVLTEGRKQIFNRGRRLVNAPVNKDAVRINGNDDIGIIKVVDGNVSIDYVSGNTFDLKNFPGGSFEANFNKINIFDEILRYIMILILNDKGEIWLQHTMTREEYDARGEKINPNRWIKVQIDAKIIWMNSVEFKADLDVSKVTILIDDRGRIFSLRLRWNPETLQFQPNLEIIATIPGVLGIYVAGEDRDVERFNELDLVLSMRS